METRALCTNVIVVTAIFLYDHIFIRFGCPLTIVTNQGIHFINDNIHYLTNHFIFKHTNSTVYYPQWNGQVKSTNNFLSKLFMKLVNENWNDKDEHMSTILLSYKTTFKVGTGHTPFQIVDKLHPITTYIIHITI